MKKLLEKYGVIKKGHFLLTSGRHSGQYINKDAIYCIPTLFSFIVNKIYTNILNEINYDNYDVITGPAIAGAVLAAPIALKLGKIFVYPEKVIKSELADDPDKGVTDTSIMKFRRDYNKVLKHKRVLIIEDIITTGKSVEQTIMAIKDCQGSVVGISAIWNRGIWSKTNNFPNIHFSSLINEYVLSYFPKACPLCRENRIPLQDPKR